MFRHRIFVFLVLVSINPFLYSCQQGGSPIEPTGISVTGMKQSTTSNRLRWGFWELRVDLRNETINAVPMRSSELHFDIVPLLKEKTPQSLISFSNLLIDASNHTIQVDISLKHPFPNAPQLAGFDVRGILFTRGGSMTLTDPELVLSNPNEPRLVNADGYTRWWNPKEFPFQSLLGYVDGKYGTPYLSAGYPITLAGYKVFADFLGATESLDGLTEDQRGVFRAGSTNIRRYLIDFGDTASHYLIFNYAVDANWGLIPGFKPGGPPPAVPNDFPLTANCPEPYRIRVSEISNTLTATTSSGTTGTLDLRIDVFDWQALSPISSVPMEVSVVQVEVPAFGLSLLGAVIPSSGGDSSMSTYSCSISGSCLDKLDFLDVVVSATSSEGDYQNSLTFFQGSGPLQAFYLHRAKVTDSEPYSGWVKRYSRLLYPEYPNQGANDPDIAVYKVQGNIRASTIDQINENPNQEPNYKRDSVNEWRNDYLAYSQPEHYHMPIEALNKTGLWDDINRICVSDSSTRLFFTNTNIYDEFTSPDTDPLYCYLTWMSHTYLGNAPAASWLSVFFSDGDWPRMWATDPSNGLTIGTDYIYSVWIYDVTGKASGNPGPDPNRYVIFRWAPPYAMDDTCADWQRPNNILPAGSGTGYIDRSKPYEHRLAVDDTLARTRFYMLDSVNEIEVVDCDFTKDEFSGYYPMGTVTKANLPADILRIVDIECISTKSIGKPRNYVAALCLRNDGDWCIWAFDFIETNPIDSQAVTWWISNSFKGKPLSMDALDSPMELHVLHKNGKLIYVTVFRYF